MNNNLDVIEFSIKENRKIEQRNLFILIDYSNCELLGCEFDATRPGTELLK